MCIHNAHSSFGVYLVGMQICNPSFGAGCMVGKVPVVVQVAQQKENEINFSRFVRCHELVKRMRERLFAGEI